MKTSGTKSLPVLMYHYVNDWAGAITVSPRLFEEHCRALAEGGWRGVGLAEAEDFLARGEPLPEKSLLITFDDGFLDNYLHALPILHKYGHRAALFAVAARIGTGEARACPKDLKMGKQVDIPEVLMPREDADGAVLRRDVFLNREELRAMDADGVITPASHARGHYAVFTGPEYDGAFLPENLPRTFFHTDLGPVFGLPDFKTGPGLLHRAFLPDPDLVEAVKSLVPQSFPEMRRFARQGGRAELEGIYRSFAGKMGRFEGDAERAQRMRREIAGGRADLEDILGRKVASLCWPWGKYCPEAFDLAREAGFEVFFTTREGVNPPKRPLAVRRFKAKDKDGAWLTSRVFVYSRPLLGRLYTAARF
ncbi:MAG: polysaccharide deacetylase family protein [Desulfovibrio sp.]|nr:polysaccharide deacetylase family protein [Desulfovibrio sp.]